MAGQRRGAMKSFLTTAKSRLGFSGPLRRSQVVAVRRLALRLAKENINSGKPPANLHQANSSSAAKKFSRGKSYNKYKLSRRARLPNPFTLHISAKGIPIHPRLRKKMLANLEIIRDMSQTQLVSLNVQFHDAAVRKNDALLVKKAFELGDSLRQSGNRNEKRKVKLFLAWAAAKGYIEI
jgi:hypothetical protein